jgi:hypothetical protein
MNTDETQMGIRSVALWMTFLLLTARRRKASPLCPKFGFHLCSSVFIYG